MKNKNNITDSIFLEDGANKTPARGPSDGLANFFNSGFSGDFDNVVDFLRTLSEVSMNKTPGAGYFGILSENGGGYSKTGEKTTYGNFSISGREMPTSFRISQKNIEKIKNSKKQSLRFDKETIETMDKILSSSSVSDLNIQEQAMLALSNLREKNDLFSEFLLGNIPENMVYGDSDSWEIAKERRRDIDIHGARAYLNLPISKRAYVEKKEIKIPSYNTLYETFEGEVSDVADIITESQGASLFHSDDTPLAEALYFKEKGKETFKNGGKIGKSSAPLSVHSVFNSIYIKQG